MGESDRENRKTWVEQHPLWAFGLGAVGLLVLCGFYFWHLNSWKWPEPLKGAGEFGDAFGALNAFISGLAFIGLLLALYLQRRDLEMQRESLILQQKELRENTAEAKRSADALARQVKISELSARLLVLPLLIERQIKITKRLIDRYNNTNNISDSPELDEINNLILIYQSESYPPRQVMHFAYESTFERRGTATQEDRIRALNALLKLKHHLTEMVDLYDDLRNKPTTIDIHS